MTQKRFKKQPFLHFDGSQDGAFVVTIFPAVSDFDYLINLHVAATLTTGYGDFENAKLSISFRNPIGKDGNRIETSELHKETAFYTRDLEKAERQDIKMAGKALGPNYGQTTEALALLNEFTTGKAEADEATIEVMAVYIKWKLEEEFECADPEALFGPAAKHPMQETFETTIKELNIQEAHEEALEAALESLITRHECWHHGFSAYAICADDPATNHTAYALLCSDEPGFETERPL